MAAFEYLALDNQGRQQKGLLEADSPRQARQQLRERNWSPLEIKQAKAREEKSRSGLSFGQGLSARDLALQPVRRVALAVDHEQRHPQAADGGFHPRETNPTVAGHPPHGGQPISGADQL